MDLEDLKTDLEIQLTQIQNSINQLQNRSKTSNNSQTDSLIFSELRTLMKEQNEQGKQSLSENVSSLNNNANSICRELRNSVDRATSDLQRQLTTTTTTVGSAISKHISTAEKSFLETVKNGKAEVTKAVAEQRKAIFKTWANCLLFIFVGIILTCIGTIGFNFFKIQDGFYKELAENKKLESIQKQAVEDYKNELYKDPDHKELTKLVDNWNKKNGSK